MPEEMKHICIWSEDEDSNYHTGCGGMFIINDGTPKENNMKFCCYCGDELKQDLYKDSK